MWEEGLLVYITFDPCWFSLDKPSKYRVRISCTLEHRWLFLHFQQKSCGDPTISLHWHTVPLVQWSTLLLLVMRDLYQTIWSRCRDVVLEGHIIGMRNCWGQENGMGRERGGGGQFTSNLGPEWTGVAPHTKEGFQVSERDLGTKEGLAGKGGIIKGNCQGDSLRGLGHVLWYCRPCIYISCYCVYVANKRIVFRW